MRRSCASCAHGIRTPLCITLINANNAKAFVFIREPLIKSKNCDCRADKCSASADNFGGCATLIHPTGLFEATLKGYTESKETAKTALHASLFDAQGCANAASAATAMDGGR